MDVSARALWTVLHGMGLGALYLLAGPAAILELWRRHASAARVPVGDADEGVMRTYLPAMTVLAAAVGGFALAALAIVADHVGSFRAWMIFYKPTGPLSVVTTLAITVWLLLWAVLQIRWDSKTVTFRPVATGALTLHALALRLTFPPVGDLF